MDTSGIIKDNEYNNNRICLVQLDKIIGQFISFVFSKTICTKWGLIRGEKVLFFLMFGPRYRNTGYGLYDYPFKIDYQCFLN